MQTPPPPSSDDRIHIRGSFQLAGLLSAMLGTAWSLYSGSSSDASNLRHIDDAIQRVDARINGLETRVNANELRFSTANQRLWDEIIKQRKEIKDDLRYELEHAK